MGDQKQSSYRNIMKGTAIFGGVQVFNILMNILRGKFIALFLGPEGMGIMSLFTSTTNTINQFTGFGLSLSAVKDISQANEQGDITKLSRIVAVFRRLTTATGVLAGFVSIAFAPWLSELTFGSKEYSWEFVALAVMLFFMAKGAAETSLLQGARQLKSLAKSTLIGTGVGLVIGIPLYAFWGEQGIVPTMIVAAFGVYLTNRYFTSKIKLEKTTITPKEVIRDGKGMLSLGMVMMIATLIGTVVLYLINIFIRWQGDAADVGLYQAASSITNQYVGVVFAAMAVDYFPRLAAISSDNNKIKEVVANQLEIVMLIIAPLIVAIIVTAPLVVKILLTDEFLTIIPLLRLLAVGLLLKAFIYPMGYIAFSKGDKKVFFWVDGVFSTQTTLIFSILFYWIWGLNGLGWAFITANGVSSIVCLIVIKIRYNFTLPKSVLPMLLVISCAVILSFATFAILGDSCIIYAINSFLLIGISWYCFKVLDKKISIRDWMKAKFIKRKANES